MQHKATTQPTRPLPPLAEIFPKRQLVERHPHLLTHSRVEWAFRNRSHNGLADSIFESKGGELLAHEPGFLRWFLGLEGRCKPRAARKA